MIEPICTTLRKALEGCDSSEEDGWVVAAI
jgi:hypothetical protein